VAAITATMISAIVSINSIRLITSLRFPLHAPLCDVCGALLARLTFFFGGMANSGYRILSGPGTLLLYQAGKRLAFLPFALMIVNLGYHLLSLTTIYV
jgi:hypothetical protein